MGKKAEWNTLTLVLLFNSEVAVNGGISQRKKATGWKVPLLFCAAVMGIVGVAAVFRASPEPCYELPPELLRQARNITIDLSGPEGSLWKERIASASSGFAARDFKDERLRALAADALTLGRYDAACTAAVLIADDERRNTVFGMVFETAVKNCESLPWGVFAIRGSRSSKQVEKWSAELESRWNMCGGA